MTKIMLVEDDKSLREIYGVRLLAEGYDIVSAGDGEEALAVAIKERPQLILSDVMMPKVSGYDMLDILRSTTETKNIRVIMMTALSSEEQRARAESLGADRYLVKSQVGIEDVVRVVHEVLEDTPNSTAVTPAPATRVAATRPQPTPGQAAGPQQPSAPVPTATVPPRPATPAQPPVAPPTPVPTPPGQPSMSTDITPPTPTPNPVPKPASLQSRVIQPINDPSSQPVDINQLLDKELAKEAGITEDALPTVASTAQERDIVSQQLQDFQPPALPTPDNDPATPAVPENLGLTGDEEEPHQPLPTPGVGTSPTVTPPQPTQQQVPPPATVPPTLPSSA